MSVGGLLRIPSEMVNYSVEKDKDAEVTVLLITANVMVIGLVVGGYLELLFITVLTCSESEVGRKIFPMF